jgi:hypothetical protein
MLQHAGEPGEFEDGPSRTGTGERRFRTSSPHVHARVLGHSRLKIL